MSKKKFFNTAVILTTVFLATLSINADTVTIRKQNFKEIKYNKNYQITNNDRHEKISEFRKKNKKEEKNIKEIKNIDKNILANEKIEKPIQQKSEMSNNEKWQMMAQYAAMSKDEKIAFANSYKDKISAELGLSGISLIFYDGNNIGETTLGTNVIKINSMELDVYQMLLHSIAHELRHNWQYKTDQHYYFDNYTLGPGYSETVAEKDANAYADQKLLEFCP